MKITIEVENYLNVLSHGDTMFRIHIRVFTIVLKTLYIGTEYQKLHVTQHKIALKYNSLISIKAFHLIATEQAVAELKAKSFEVLDEFQILGFDGLLVICDWCF